MLYNVVIIRFILSGLHAVPLAASQSFSRVVVHSITILSAMGVDMT